MAERITEKDLKQKVAQLNLKRGKVPGEYGCYELDWSYGGVKLQQFNEGGYVDISKDGFGTKKQLYRFIQGMLS